VPNEKQSSSFAGRLFLGCGLMVITVINADRMVLLEVGVEIEAVILLKLLPFRNFLSKSRKYPASFRKFILKFRNFPVSFRKFILKFRKFPASFRNFPPLFRNLCKITQKM
jgi:hypothetical protein